MLDYWRVIQTPEKKIDYRGSMMMFQRSLWGEPNVSPKYEKG